MIEFRNEPCWTYTRRDDDEDVLHWHTKAALDQDIEHNFDAEYNAGRRCCQLPQPCWLVRSDGSRHEILADPENDWELCAPDRASAEQWALDMGWTLMRDGSVYHPDESPDHNWYEEAAPMQVPGQLTLDEALAGHGSEAAA
jgi:hypothetical protein